jgi:hypothetical protein
VTNQRGLGSGPTIQLAGVRRALGGADDRMTDTPREEKCQSIGIDSPNQRPNPKRLPIRRDKLKSNRGAAPKPYPRCDFRPLPANVYRLTRMAALPHFNEHGPLDTSPRVLAPFPLMVARFTQ